MSYSDLEYRVADRTRGSRQQRIGHLLAELTGAERAVAVNNNAAAVLLALMALGRGREVIVSRGELVEIGGSFRLPDVMMLSGAKLVEVGTTNKTRLSDYETAIRPETALILKVHRSNFVQIGFTAEVSYPELARLAKERGLLSLADVGSGVLAEARLGPIARREPTVNSVVAAGIDIVTFSGDKLLGGPQAGLIVGRSDAIGRIAEFPLMRALRLDKMTLAALDSTLRLYRDGRAAEIPTNALLTAPLDVLFDRAQALAVVLRESAGSATVEVVKVKSAVGGGALPDIEPESYAISLTHPRIDAEGLEAAFRAANPPVIGRISDGRYILDVRALLADDILSIGQAAKEATQRMIFS